MKKIHFSLIIVLIASVVMIFTPADPLLSQAHDHKPGESCSHGQAAAPKPEPAADPHAGHNHAANDTCGGHGQPTAVDPHAGQDHAAHDHSAHTDFSGMPIDELYKPECEHKIKMIDCDECRYELGAVKMTEQLKKMLKTSTLATTAEKHEVAFRGELEYDNQLFRSVSSLVPGVIVAMPVRKGEIVEQGQVLVEIESPELSHTALDLQKLIAELALAEKKLAREEMLNEKKIGALQAVQEAKAARDLLAIEIKCSKERLKLSGLSDSEIKAVSAGGNSQLFKGRLKVASPIRGRVLMLHANIGGMVSERQALVDVVDISQLRAVGQIKEADLPAIVRALKKGAVNGYITTQAYPGFQFPVQALSADAGLKTETRMLEIQLAVKNPDELLRPGMFIEGTLQIGEGAAKPALPAAAVLEDEGKQFVFIKHQDSMLFRRNVTIDGQQGDTIFIGSGIKAGDEVVVEGSFLLKSDILRGKMGAGCAH
ncbi:MAG TPA: efflux RND transporter periplasmic adaptor subunit [Candidatus Rifleibacterium sp.]|nr:efflux RND transporter periplasmic adaptor subunit [Candidatus Rifleibacterium sp.]